MLNKFFRKKKKMISNDLMERKQVAQSQQLPSHIAIIMDGNGRWAKKRTLPRVTGHHEGMKTVKKITKFANEVGINTLTLYAFSTENWKRPKLEVEFLMRLPEEFLGTYLPELMEQNVQVKMMGNIDSLPEHTKSAINKAVEQTANNDGLILNFAMNYGSEMKLCRQFKKLYMMYKKVRSLQII